MRFIVLDGLDGSGKDTQALKIAAMFLKQHENVILRSHPAEDNYFGRKTRENLLLTGKRAHLLAAIYYTIDVIRSVVLFYRPSQARIIFVRYLMGTAYLPRNLMFCFYNFFEKILPTTKYSFFIDVNTSVARKRIIQRGTSEEMFESTKKLIKMRKKMNLLAARYNWIIIDGNKNQEESWKQLEIFFSR